MFTLVFLIASKKVKNFVCGKKIIITEKFENED